MHRRRYLAAVGGSLGLVSLSGCTGLLPIESEREPQYPGGTVVVENAGDSTLSVHVSVADRGDSPAFDATIPAGETRTEREFVTASTGEAVTLSAVVGDDGDPTTFEFLPAGGTDAPPEVARLTVENRVEASAQWTATAGME